MSLEAEAKGTRRAVQRDHDRRPGGDRVVSDPVDRRLDRRRAQGGRGASSPRSRRSSATRPSSPLDDPEWRKWMNQDYYVRQGVSFLEMTAGAARSGAWLAPRLAERQGAEADARHHAPQPHARRAERQRLRSLRRMALPHHGDGDAVGDRALGLAARRAPRDHQLLRAGRSGRDDAVVRRIGAGDRHVREVRGHVDSAGRAESRAWPWSTR